MSDFEDKIKVDSDLFLRETPEEKVRNRLSRMKKPRTVELFGGLEQVTPPSRNGKIRKPETAEDKKKRFKTFSLIVLATLGAMALMNYRRIADFIYTSIATVEMVKGDLAGAAKHYKDAYFINPSDVSPLLFAASIHLGQKQDQLAKEEFDEVFKLAKDPAFVHNQRAKILNGMGRTDEALADWTEAIRINPNYYAAHGQRARIYLNRKQYAESLTEWDAAIKNELDSKDVYCLSQKAAVLSHMQRYREALETIDLAIKRDPENTGLTRQRNYFLAHL